MSATDEVARWNIAVVILSWNGRDDTLACLRSLPRDSQPGLRRIVVDNGSSDGTVQALREQHPDVMVIETGRNLGFAGGNNAGIERALADGADAVLVLNNDTEVETGAIERLTAALRADPAAGACSPVLPHFDDPARLWFAGASFDPRRAHAGRNSDYERGTATLPATPIAVDRLVGAALLARAQALREIGGFADELFFLYEDIDWSLRARAAGWRLLLVPGARVPHKVAASQGGRPHTPTTAYYGTRNDLEVGRRHGGLAGWRAGLREAGCAGVHLAALRRAPRGTRLACVRATLEGWRDYRRRSLGPRPAP